MGYLIGVVRMILAALLVFMGALGMIPFALIPARYRGARLGAWWVTLLARIFNRIFNIRFHCTNPALLSGHHGLLFPNHCSYVDIVALFVTAPVRFLAAAEVRKMPFIGWMAASVDTVFVDRGNTHSRRAARSSVSAVLQSDPYPPIVIFPEGRLGPGDQLFPFRHGAFELAIHNQVAYLPVAMRYNRPDVVTWYGGLRDEALLAAVWRLAIHRGRITVDVMPLAPVTPAADADAAQVAAATQRAIEQVLGFPPAPTDLNGSATAPAAGAASETSTVSAVAREAA